MTVCPTYAGYTFYADNAVIGSGITIPVTNPAGDCTARADCFAFNFFTASITWDSDGTYRNKGILMGRNSPLEYTVGTCVYFKLTGQLLRVRFSYRYQHSGGWAAMCIQYLLSLACKLGKASATKYAYEACMAQLQ